VTERNNLIDSIALKIRDYRAGDDVAPRTPQTVELWIDQFDARGQIEILKSINHVLARTYSTKPEVEAFIARQMLNPEMTASSPADFWRNTQILEPVEHGTSCADMRRLLTDALDHSGLTTGDGADSITSFVYIDDFLCSGLQFQNNIESWLARAPRAVTVDVILVGLHRYGRFTSNRYITARAKDLGKSVTIRFWPMSEVEDRVSYRNESDVLWPMVIPKTDAAQRYVNQTNQSDKYAFEPRSHRIEPAESVFDSAAGRAHLEQELFLAGIRIRDRIQSPKDVMRPLGFRGYGLGHGTMVADYRNCPNNSPLAIWWGCNDWHPLLPRRTNKGIDGP